MPPKMGEASVVSLGRSSSGRSKNSSVWSNTSGLSGAGVEEPIGEKEWLKVAKAV